MVLLTSSQKGKVITEPVVILSFALVGEAEAAGVIYALLWHYLLICCLDEHTARFLAMEGIQARNDFGFPVIQSNQAFCSKVGCSYGKFLLI